MQIDLRRAVLFQQGRGHGMRGTEKPDAIGEFTANPSEMLDVR
jgi:hypothetical protein